MLDQGAPLEQGDLGGLRPHVHADHVPPDRLAPALASAAPALGPRPGRRRRPGRPGRRRRRRRVRPDAAGTVRRPAIVPGCGPAAGVSVAAVGRARRRWPGPAPVPAAPARPGGAGRLSPIFGRSGTGRGRWAGRGGGAGRRRSDRSDGRRPPPRPGPAASGVPVVPGRRRRAIRVRAVPRPAPRAAPVCGCAAPAPPLDLPAGLRTPPVGLSVTARCRRPGAGDGAGPAGDVTSEWAVGRRPPANPPGPPPAARLLHLTSISLLETSHEARSKACAARSAPAASPRRRGAPRGCRRARSTVAFCMPGRAPGLPIRRRPVPPTLRRRHDRPRR